MGGLLSWEEIRLVEVAGTAGHGSALNQQFRGI
jgi:hypothetical protein